MSVNKKGSGGPRTVIRLSDNLVRHGGIDYGGRREESPGNILPLL